MHTCVLFLEIKKVALVPSYLPGLHQLQLQPPHGSHSTRVDLAHKLIHAKFKSWKMGKFMGKDFFNHESSGNGKRRIDTRCKAVPEVLVGKCRGLLSVAAFA